MAAAWNGSVIPMVLGVFYPNHSFGYVLLSLVLCKLVAKTGESYGEVHIHVDILNREQVNWVNNTPLQVWYGKMGTKSNI